MKKYASYTGLFMIIIGTLLLTATKICQWDTHNWLLLSGLLCIVSGIVLHIRSIKG